MTNDRVAADLQRVQGLVQGAAGRPLRAATVCIGAPSKSWTACVRSDASGHFEFAPAALGARYVIGSAPGYFSQIQPIALGAAAELVLRLQPGGTAVRGNVVDVTGGPVVGAQLAAYVDGQAAASALAESDAAGAFELSVPGRSLRLEARANGYSTARRELPVVEGSVTLLLVPASSIVGRVVLEQGEGQLPPVSVNVDSELGLAGVALSAEVDALGNFRIDDVAAGSYSLQARAPDWRSAREWISVGVGEISDPVRLVLHRTARLHGTVSAPGGACREGRVEVVGPVALLGEVDPVSGAVQIEGLLPGDYEATVRCPGALALHDSFSAGSEPLERQWHVEAGLSLEGRVENQSGEPASGLRVLVQPDGAPAEHTRRPPDPVSCISDASAEFRCSGFEAGSYMAAAEGGTPVRVELTEAASARVVLKTRQSAAIVVSFEAGAEPLSRAASVFVQARGGRPMLGNRNGDQLTFDGLPLGNYELHVGSDSVQSVSLTRHGQVTELRLNAPRSVVIAGRVRDERGVPVPDAWVSASGALQALRTVGPASDPVLSDADGNFELRGLLPGLYDLTATTQGGEGHVQGISGGDPGVALVVQRRARLSGSVTDASGAPVRAFTLRYSSSRESSEIRGVGGRWSLPWLEPDRYLLDAASALGAAHSEVEVQAGEERELSLQVSPSSGAP